jgi:glutamyl-tRNA synthetase
MEIFENLSAGSRLVPDACSPAARGPGPFPKADGRFAPSPTGPLHLGNLRTALLTWLFARSAGARFLVRVEDLDRSRVRPGVKEAQLADLRAIGLDWDGPIVRQSERIFLYEEAIARLDSDGHLYPCYCTRAEIRASASAPHGIPAADRYPGICRELTATERAEREATGRPPSGCGWRGRAWPLRTVY